jgi:hypothetical protein
MEGGVTAITPPFVFYEFSFAKAVGIVRLLTAKRIA